MKAVIGQYRQSSDDFRTLIFTDDYAYTKTVDHVVMAVPLGILKAGDIIMQAPSKTNPTGRNVDALCDRMVDAIYRAGMLYNYV